MSDEEHETVTYTTEVHEEDVLIKCEDNFTKNTHNELLKPKVRRSFNDLRQRRQKFCLRWGLEFPWLKPNPSDESIGYCTICRRDLVCKKSHLERHQKTFKHMRLQGFENVYTVNEPEADLIEAHTTGYLDNDNDYEDEMTLDDENVEYTTIKVEPAKLSTSTEASRIKSNKFSQKRSKIDKSPLTTFTTIEKIEREPSLNSTPLTAERKHERLREMSDFYYMPRPPPKDCFDLFFESISATVKNLPPKLAAEVKSRVSQLIAEFELRAICEKEALEKAAATVSQQTVTTLAPVANVVAVDQSICSGSSTTPTRVAHQQIEGQTIAHYVYSYQSK